MLMLMLIIPGIFAGLIQGVTGFGTGIILMLFLPSQFGVTRSAALAASIGIMICLAMSYRYREKVNYKNIILPSLIFITASSISIYYSKMVNQETMKLIFGIFLIILAGYFLFIAKDASFKPSAQLSLLFFIISGICDGLFGVGGPLMVIYFLSITDDQREYLGTIQTFFAVNAIYLTMFRVYNHILSVEHIKYIALGIISILSGLFVANRIVDKINGAVLRKFVYILIAISGVINITTVLL